MTDDEKVAFYLRHRERIQEWAKLQEIASRAASSALTEAFRARLGSAGHEKLVLGKGWQGETARLPVEANGHRVDIGLWWSVAKMTFTRGYGAWPELGIWSTSTCPPRSPAHQVIMDGTRTPAAQAGLITAGQDWFWRHNQRAATEPFDIDEYADEVATRLHATWVQLTPPIVEVLDGLEPPRQGVTDVQTAAV